VGRFRALVVGLLVIVSGPLASFSTASPAAAIEARGTTLTALLDGVAIPLEEVSKYYCDDFSYPVITCSVSPLLHAVRTTAFALLASVDYVTVFEHATFQGASMNISQDYPVLTLIGWNDRISSFKVRNGETGRFSVDWLYAGSGWSFCCNTQQGTLGGYDNTFSSVQRT
jgi:hypothetical protein